jgi:hypothetical protein
MPDTPLIPHHRRLLLIGRLNDAEDDHYQAIRAIRMGVNPVALDQGAQRRRALGLTIADLARLVSGQCAAGAFCDARPAVEPLAVRLIEAIDDQLDTPAWRVIDAQVRLQVATTGE